MKTLTLSNDAYTAILKVAEDNGLLMEPGRRLPSAMWEVDVDDEVYEALAELDTDLNRAVILLSAGGKPN